MTLKTGYTIRRLRHLRGISQDKLAVLMNCSQSVISHYEQGFCEPSLTALGEISNAFEMDIADFIDLVQQDQKFYEVEQAA